MDVRPFLKWAGGKTQSLSKIRAKYPLALGDEICRYCEPFVGGGAVLFDVLANYKIEEILINDINYELINVYWQIQKNINALIERLERLENSFLPLSQDDRRKYYYKKRSLFNFYKKNEGSASEVEKAALFVFLNKTCFNGLYRVNRQGLFNVPMGIYKKPLICDKQNLYAVHQRLQNVRIVCGDYKDCLGFVDKHTFVYIDPPYRPLTSTACFTSYYEFPFNDKEQIVLSEYVMELHNMGAKILLSNSDPKIANDEDDFFDELYKTFFITRIAAKRMINCNGKKRGAISELLITNY